MSVNDLRGNVSGEPAHTIYIGAFGRSWLNSNDRGHWRKHSPLVREWRDAASWAAIGAKVPPLRRVYVLAELRWTDNNRRRDPANYYPTVKACVDGLVTAGVLFDDSAKHLIGPDMRQGPKASTVDALYLHLWELPDEEE